MTKLLVNNETLMTRAKELKEHHKGDKELSFFVDRLIARLESGPDYNLLIHLDIKAVNVLIQEDKEVEPYTTEEIKHYLDNPEGELMPILFSHKTSKKLELYSNGSNFPNAIAKKNKTILDTLKKVINSEGIDSILNERSNWDENDGVQEYTIFVQETTRRILHQLFGRENPLYKVIQLLEDNSDTELVKSVNTVYNHICTERTK